MVGSQLRILGSIEYESDERTRADLQARHALLLVYLALEAPASHDRDALAARLAVAEAAGIARDRLAIDPGIGFGKTLEHNLALLARLSVFHDLGVPVLLGASRKRFIGTIGAEAEAARRMPGSLAVALAGVAQGMQMIRVHDVAETRQALRLWQAATRGY